MLPSVYNCAKCLGVISPEPSLRNDAFDGGGDAKGRCAWNLLSFRGGDIANVQGSLACLT